MCVLSYKEHFNRRAKKEKKMNTSCPDESILARFMEDRLLDDEKDKVLNHLAKCDHCLGMVAGAHDLLHDNDIMKWENVPISDEKAQLVIKDIYTKTTPLTIKEIFVKGADKLKVGLNNFVGKFKEWRYNVSQNKTTQYAYVPVRSAEKEIHTDKIDTVIKGFDVINFHLQMVSQKKDSASLQIIPKIKDKAFEHARLYLKNDKFHLISTRPVLLESIQFDRISDGKYIIEVIKNENDTLETKDISQNKISSDIISFNIEIYNGKIVL